ncbi:MAG TPA: short-chain dehydrogenase [Elusimicrobia bacterium]|nr:short-chain dehydrogenase [Elusimicrobiota bacterium]HBT61785.1 short-chain dehydrogenase [Elusimicrobiota bacterium]
MESKVIVITGASAGIGAALAERLGREGHCLALAARRKPELEAVAARCGKALVAPTDVCRRSEVEALLDAALKAFGRVDVWVNNAGQGINRSVQELSDQDFDFIMAVNVKSALYGMQTVIPHFKRRNGGHLINVASFLGRVPVVPFRSAYNAAKAALIALTANLRMELALSHPGIHVSVVLPGAVSTGFARNALGGLPQGGWPASSVPIQTPEAVADLMAGLIAAPAAELYTHPGQQAAAVKYAQDVAGFEAERRRGVRA